MRGRSRLIVTRPTSQVGLRDQMEEALRILGRHQWVREHDTPRVSVLVGPPRSSRAVWAEWLALAGRSHSADSIIEQPATATLPWLEGTANQAVAFATTNPRVPLAVLLEAGLLQSWLGGRTDRIRAVFNEGIVSVPHVGARQVTTNRASPQRARSSAETHLYEELQRTPSTAGRFELNGLLSVAFGGCAAEVDLLSRTDEIAIEVDGYHHLKDLVAYRRDRRKDLLLQAHGYAVLRFLADDVVTNASQAVRAVLELMGQRRRLHRRNP
jgi:very-short-patch-repair endonuclease